MTDLLDSRLLTQVRGWRQDLHEIPELAFGEERTSAYVAAVLGDLGYEVTTGIGGTGLVGSLTRGPSDRAVGLRCELDGLPITEHSGVARPSRHDGRMHACGHDGHLAMVLGAAATLAHQPDLDGTVRVIFQPAEEPGRGARAMIDDGLFERFPVDRIYGIHNYPGTAAGRLLTCTGPVMAGEDNFTITIAGRGGHASAPHLVIDPLVVGAEVVVALQQVVARSVDPVRTAVLSCTEIHTDGARNAIPSTVVISGDTRSFDDDVSRLLERRIRQVSEGVAAAHGATVEVTYTREFAPTVNDEGCVDIAVRAATSALGAQQVDGRAEPVMASEDFGLLAQVVPGCLAFLGNGTELGAGGTPLHSSDYRFNDDILANGVAYLREVALASLAT